MVTSLTAEPASPPSPDREAHPRPLEDRDPVSRPRHHLRRGRFPPADRQHAPHHGNQTQPRHRCPAAERRQHHRGWSPPHRVRCRRPLALLDLAGRQPTTPKPCQCSLRKRSREHCLGRAVKPALQPVGVASRSLVNAGTGRCGRDRRVWILTAPAARGAVSSEMTNRAASVILQWDPGMAWIKIN